MDSKYGLEHSIQGGQYMLLEWFAYCGLCAVSALTPARSFSFASKPSWTQKKHGPVHYSAVNTHFLNDEKFERLKGAKYPKLVVTGDEDILVAPENSKLIAVCACFFFFFFLGGGGG